ncbi:hypothetical protein OUZ56_003108 [Daphnia magna]|uniref:Uncharacterized protein n=1 Tax=Daphnia magna TaxID=35525 RepID=A0ABR0A880_9CRUS|nr:hypothetical protein OUZ56_003108 [Daphnia magna]
MGSDRRGTDAVFRLGPNAFFRSSIGILNVNIVYKIRCLPPPLPTISSSLYWISSYYTPPLYIPTHRPIDIIPLPSQVVNGDFSIRTVYAFHRVPTAAPSMSIWSAASVLYI